MRIFLLFLMDGNFQHRLVDRDEHTFTVVLLFVLGCGH
jgi:hypothetical protein